MDDHQRQMWSQMLERVDDLHAGLLDLAKLVSDLRDLFVESPARGLITVLSADLR